jgi:hypothetical protein
MRPGRPRIGSLPERFALKSRPLRHRPAFRDVIASSSAGYGRSACAGLSSGKPHGARLSGQPAARTNAARQQSQDRKEVQ